MVVSFMKKNNFFIPTTLNKEFNVLNLISHNSQISQRYIADALGIAVSMVNEYIDNLEKKKFIIRKYKNSKQVSYYLTDKGEYHLQSLDLGYLKDSQVIYNSAKEYLLSQLLKISNNGFRNVLLYGAGEVAEIVLSVIDTEKKLQMNCLAIIDDDKEKHHKEIFNSQIISKEMINSFDHDGIIISSHSHNEKIYRGLIDLGYPKNDICQLFKKKKA